MRSRCLVLLLVALVGCRGGGGDDGEEHTTVPTSPSSMGTTTTSALSYAVPDTLDVAYVERVMAALDRLYGDLARHVAATRELDEEFARFLVSIYAGGSFESEKVLWSTVASEGFELLRERPGDARTTVERVVEARKDCIVVQARRDFFAMFNEPDPAGPPRFVALVPLPADRNPDGRNPTPWLMSFDGRYQDGHKPTAEEACTPP